MLEAERKALEARHRDELHAVEKLAEERKGLQDAYLNRELAAARQRAEQVAEDRDAVRAALAALREEVCAARGGGRTDPCAAAHRIQPAAAPTPTECDHTRSHGSGARRRGSTRPIHCARPIPVHPPARELATH
eukprot:1589670-Prymnesium_polylepis.1